jgi:MFS family permease
MVHMVPALVDKGFAPLEAAKLVGICGLAAILGKLFVGGLFDRLSFEIVSMGALAMLALACGLYVPLHGRIIPAIIAVCVLGTAVGAMYTVIACVSAKLFPAATFGLMFGTLTSIMALASAAGPTVGSLVHDRFKSYDPICLVGVGVAVVSALVLKTLEPASVESVPEAVKAE